MVLHIHKKGFNEKGRQYQEQEAIGTLITVDGNVNQYSQFQLL